MLASSLLLGSVGDALSSRRSFELLSSSSIVYLLLGCDLFTGDGVRLSFALKTSGELLATLAVSTFTVLLQSESEVELSV